MPTEDVVQFSAVIYRGNNIKFPPIKFRWYDFNTPPLK